MEDKEIAQSNSNGDNHLINIKNTQDKNSSNSLIPSRYSSFESDVQTPKQKNNGIYNNDQFSKVMNNTPLSDNIQNCNNRIDDTNLAEKQHLQKYFSNNSAYKYTNSIENQNMMNTHDEDLDAYKTNETANQSDINNREKRINEYDEYKSAHGLNFQNNFYKKEEMYEKKLIEPIKNTSIKKEEDQKGSMKIFVSNYGDNIYRNTEIEKNQTESCRNFTDQKYKTQYYDENKLSPLYKNKSDKFYDTFSDEKKELHFNSIDKLMKEIQIFNNSMQTIASNDPTFIQKNNKNMYSENNSHKRETHEINNNLIIENQISCSNTSTDVCFVESPQNSNRETPTILDHEEYNLQDYSNHNCYEKIDSIKSFKNFAKSEIKTENSASYIEDKETHHTESKQDNLMDSQLNRSDVEYTDHASDKNSSYKQNDVSPNSIKLTDVEPYSKLDNEESIETSKISSNQWEEMKKSFYDIENNLLYLSKENNYSLERNIEGNELMNTKNSETNEEIKFEKDETPKISYHTDEETTKSQFDVDTKSTIYNYVQKDSFPNYEYDDTENKHLNITKHYSDKDDIFQNKNNISEQFNYNYLHDSTNKQNSLNNSTPKDYQNKSNSYYTDKEHDTHSSHTRRDILPDLNLERCIYSKEGSPIGTSDTPNGIDVSNRAEASTRNDAAKISPIGKGRTPRSSKSGGSTKASFAVVKTGKIKQTEKDLVKTPKVFKKNEGHTRTSVSGHSSGNVGTKSPSNYTISSSANYSPQCNNGGNGITPTSTKANKNEKDITYNMNVVIRCRPMSNSEKNEGAKNVIKIMDNKMIVLLDPCDNSDNVLRQNRTKEKRYCFDYVFDENSTQEDVYNNSVKPLVDAVIKGYNSTVFAYGATGAGKTHTIIGYKNEPGVMMMILQDLFKKIKTLKAMNEYIIKCSFIEIYNENICDLLNPSSEYLDLREDPVKGITVSNIFEVCTTSVEEIMELIHTGNRNRTQEPTDANRTSSRSHGVLQVTVEETEKGQGLYQQTKKGKLCVIDLAGSERASQTNNKGMRMLEGANINRSLLALGNVINALVSRSKGTSKSNFIPFRDSKLTRLLKDSLGGNCKTLMIANISPSHLSYEDTHNTLKYANRAKNIKNIVTSNSVVVKHHLTMYIDVIEKLKTEIESLKEQLNDKEKIHDFIISESNSTNYDYYDSVKDCDKNSSREELLNIIYFLKRENQKLRCNLGSMTPHTPTSDSSTPTHELIKYGEEINNIKMINEKLFIDNKRFQVNLQEHIQISENLKEINEEYKNQISSLKNMLYNHDVSHLQMRRWLDDLKRKYTQLKENIKDNDNAQLLEGLQDELNKVFNERKQIKNFILNIERNLVENKEIAMDSFKGNHFKMLQENKNKMENQLQINIKQTNNLINKLVTNIKDEQMKSFMYLFYTNTLLMQEREDFQDFFELSSVIINHKEKQLQQLMDTSKISNISNVPKK
ncbi:kinesin-8, putative [Plasmodium chabaudi chabaudi]|uniref:Kinesin-like protein KIN-8B n=1 Tax=Plasmodium chabaudi chabaudi TaxID=31271 RepID=A0A4V0K2M9_PLACU|nr:kinesin-8, putative [Plasmodium chabaudi chabaudi]VTZ66788.1 kinesin-8, putative [Plasmodium chabaudi chabaudi]|eukprot:XP_016653058.1 kinesin-8, putative [Plasmodium chabaudi chabaudi]